MLSTALQEIAGSVVRRAQLQGSVTARDIREELTRIGEPENLWKDVLANSVKAEGPDLSARQAAILMRIYLEPGPHTVRGLAGALNLGKPAVSRALDALTVLDV